MPWACCFGSVRQQEKRFPQPRQISSVFRQLPNSVVTDFVRYVFWKFLLNALQQLTSYQSFVSF